MWSSGKLWPIGDSMNLTSCLFILAVLDSSPGSPRRYWSMEGEVRADGSNSKRIVSRRRWALACQHDWLTLRDGGRFWALTFGKISVYSSPIVGLPRPKVSSRYTARTAKSTAVCRCASQRVPDVSINRSPERFRKCFAAGMWAVVLVAFINTHLQLTE